MSTIASHSPLNISETARDRGLVSKDHQWEMAYWESNGHVTDDVMWPERSNSWPQIHLERNISETAGVAVLSTILATAWLLVCIYSATYVNNFTLPYESSMNVAGPTYLPKFRSSC